MEGRERATRCKWIDRDEEGRPRCEHGWAYKGGGRFRCPMKHKRSKQMWDRTEAGVAAKAKWNRSEQAAVSKALYELTRIRLV